MATGRAQGDRHLRQDLTNIKDRVVGVFRGRKWSKKTIKQLAEGAEAADAPSELPKGSYFGLQKLLAKVLNPDSLLKDKYWAMSCAELEAEYDKAGNPDLIVTLKQFHRTANPIAKYDSDQPVKTLLRFSGTGLHLVFMRFDFYFLLGLHLLFTWLFNKAGGEASGGLPDLKGWPKISVAYISVPGSIIVFALTFYVNQTYNRYLDQFKHVGGSLGCMGDMLMLMRVHMPDNAFAEARKVRIQMLQFIQSINFLALGGMAQNRQEKIDRWVFYTLKKRNLLTKEQIQICKTLMFTATSNGSLAYKEVIMWVTRGIWAQVALGNLRTEIATIFTMKLWDAAGHFGALYGAPSGPVPFAYYHLLNFMVIVYLLLLSYAFIFVAPVWSILGFVIIEIAVIGMRELGDAMSNPFGVDTLDIPVFDDAERFYKMTNDLVNRSTNYPDELPALVLKGKVHQPPPRSHIEMSMQPPAMQPPDWSGVGL
eukprot:TRINITY_DN154_c0_g1_i1.p1 TRINITY_DN154_c0_g1~~TRINITY_DN154_c0_g1_i1.p1  ORF type:complete len:481 (-),score=92.23 TRINITY_DN154_c0_g1_i1:497-1939(-)